MKQNCWEFKKCDQAMCPARTQSRLGGAHDGKNAGRACWVVAGTHCGVEVLGAHAKAVGNCERCDFYNLVKTEEGGAFLTTNELLAIAS